MVLELFWAVAKKFEMHKSCPRLGESAKRNTGMEYSLIDNKHSPFKKMHCLVAQESRKSKSEYVQQ